MNLHERQRRSALGAVFSSLERARVVLDPGDGARDVGIERDESIETALEAGRARRHERAVDELVPTRGP